MNQQVVPDHEELARLIHSAFEALPEPDADRLAMIESRLAEQLQRPRRRRAMHWGWLLLLAGGAATATWWIGHSWSPQKTTRSEQEQVGSIQSGSPGDTGNDKQAQPAGSGKETSEAAGRQDSPVIYRREDY